MIIPTVGALVLVYRQGKADSESYLNLDTTQPEPALISYVFNKHKINVGGFTQYGEPFAFCDIQILQDIDQPPLDQTFAMWPGATLPPPAEVKAPSVIEPPPINSGA